MQTYNARHLNHELVGDGVAAIRKSWESKRAQPAGRTKVLAQWWGEQTHTRSHVHTFTPSKHVGPTCHEVLCCNVRCNQARSSFNLLLFTKALHVRVRVRACACAR